MSGEPAKVIEIFYSYAHEDEDLRNQLFKHLSSLRHEGLIVEWHDRLWPVPEDAPDEVRPVIGFRRPDGKT